MINLIIHHASCIPPKLRNDLAILEYAFSGEQWTLETGSHRMYYYKIDQKHLQQVRRILKGFPDVKFIVTNKFDHHFD